MPDGSRGTASGFYFTLNQDLMFERAFRPVSRSTPYMPYISGIPATFWQDGQKRIHKPYDENREAIEVDQRVTRGWDLSKRFNFIKLHGSFNWRVEGQSMMVLGGGKLDTLDRFPVLRAYYELFHDVLTNDRMRLLIVGYSFNDLHINEIISYAAWDAIVDYFTRTPVEIFGKAPQFALSGEVERLNRSFVQHS